MSHTCPLKLETWHRSIDVDKPLNPQHL